eukprot:1620065-Rhodomonas_salina.1
MMKTSFLGERSAMGKVCFACGWLRQACGALSPLERSCVSRASAITDVALEKKKGESPRRKGESREWEKGGREEGRKGGREGEGTWRKR